MSQLITNEQKLNDIIFANRNKEYGAYAIRSSYGNTVFKSLSFMIFGVGTIVSVGFLLSNRNQPPSDLGGQVFVHDSIYVIPFDNTEKPEEPAEPRKEKPALPSDPETSTSTSTIISDSVDVSQVTTDPNAVASTSISSTDLGLIPGSPGGSGSGTSTAATSSLGTGDEVLETFRVDSEPIFEGGLNALYRFVSANLKYPTIASEYGKEGTVYVKFVVDEEGKVGRLSLLNSIGYGMDDEALRVVSIIPKFKSPAKAKGIPVKVYYQMPIRFRFR